MTALKRTVMATMVFLRHRGVMPFTFLAPLCPGHAAYGAEPVGDNQVRVRFELGALGALCRERS
ncbi:hypothetical protein QJQ45_020408 [Haematococcus lacustris]|nr:hypothetical protein QJQ45_020408 [Haematococcus lacustris]